MVMDMKIYLIITTHICNYAEEMKWSNIYIFLMHRKPSLSLLEHPTNDTLHLKREQSHFDNFNQIANYSCINVYQIIVLLRSSYKSDIGITKLLIHTHILYLHKDMMFWRHMSNKNFNLVNLWNIYQEVSPQKQLTGSVHEMSNAATFCELALEIGK